MYAAYAKLIELKIKRKVEVKKVNEAIEQHKQKASKAAKGKPAVVIDD